MNSWRSSPVGSGNQTGGQQQQEDEVGEELGRGGAGQEQEADQHQDAAQEGDVQNDKGGLLQAGGSSKAVQQWRNPSHPGSAALTGCDRYEQTHVDTTREGSC